MGCHLSVQSLISWWCHQMETYFVLLTLCEGNPLVTGGFPSQRPVMQSFDVFFICTWTNGWANSRDTGTLRCYHAHYDVNVMCILHLSLSYYLWYRLWYTMFTDENLDSLPDLTRWRRPWEVNKQWQRSYMISAIAYLPLMGPIYWC